MKLILAARIGALLGACAAVQPLAAQPPERTIYQRYAELQSDPQFQARMAAPAARIGEFSWMLGDWDVTVTVFATPTTPERIEREQTTFRMLGDARIVSNDLSTVFGFDAFGDRWFSAGFEMPAVPFAIGYGPAHWDGHSIVFLNDARIFGETVSLRSTLTRLGPDEFDLLNEQRVGPDLYVRVDAYHDRRTARR